MVGGVVVVCGVVVCDVGYAVVSVDAVVVSCCCCC